MDIQSKEQFSLPFSASSLHFSPFSFVTSQTHLYLTTTSHLDVMLVLQKEERMEGMEMVLMIAWGLWNRTNKEVFESVTVHLDEAVSDALFLMQDFQNSPKAPISPNRSNILWFAPSTGALKLNMDGVIFAE